MGLSFEAAAGPSQCFLVGSLLVLIGIALPVVRTIIIQLDDAPNETLTYTISDDAARPDVEEELPAAARVSELTTGATGQK